MGVGPKSSVIKRRGQSRRRRQCAHWQRRVGTYITGQGRAPVTRRQENRGTDPFLWSPREIGPMQPCSWLSIPQNDEGTYVCSIESSRKWSFITAVQNMHAPCLNPASVLSTLHEASWMQWKGLDRRVWLVSSLSLQGHQSTAGILCFVSPRGWANRIKGGSIKSGNDFLWIKTVQTGKDAQLCMTAGASHQEGARTTCNMNTKKTCLGSEEPSLQFCHH